MVEENSIQFIYNSFVTSGMKNTYAKNEPAINKSRW